MDEENIYDRIQGIFGHFPENFSILEEQIDIDLQMEYFEFSRNYKQNPVAGKILTRKEQLFHKEYPIPRKKKLLVQLASLEEVEAYRAIEKYLKDPDPEIKEWAILAFQESRMLIQSKLLDENQVFISTGLGGRGSKLRYFVVLINNYDKAFEDLQRKLIKTEFEFFLKKHDAELEKVNFMKNYCTLLTMVPIRASIREVFKTAIAECNQYGDFIKDNFIVTNVKALSYEEINEFVGRQNNTGDSDGL
jgi:hypothetical protein